MSQPLQDQPGQPYTAGVPGQPPAPYQGWAPHPTTEAYAAGPVPGLVPPQGASVIPHPHPQAGQLGIVAVALAGIVTAVEVVEAFLAWPAEEQLRAAVAEGATPSDVLTPLDVIAVPGLLAILAAWVVTAIWLTKVRENAEALHPTAPHARSKVWAWLGWFTPVVALWFPRQFVRDVRAATASEERKYSTIVGWWWALWLVYNFSSQFAGYITTSVQPGAGVEGLGVLETISAVLAVAAFVLWARMVLEIGKDQRAVALGRPTVRVVR